jgi:aspartyl-tRNA(Asn)/glutamyl-tRNA(Gln) amidotransferase subunit C
LASGKACVKKSAVKITAKEVERVADLARLRLTADEISELTGQLDSILSFMEQLNTLDTTGVEPFRHATDSDAALRDDAVVNSPDPESLLANSPDRDGTFFKVPKILE